MDDVTQFNALLERLDRVNQALQGLIQAQLEANVASDKQQQTPEVLRAELKIPHSEKYASETHATRQLLTDAIKLYVEILTLIAVLAYTTVAALQLREIIKQYPKIEESAKAASDAAGAMSDQLDLQRNVVRLEKGGAQLGILNISLFHEQRENLSAGFLIKNNGKYAAREISLCFDIRFIKPLPTEDPRNCKFYNPASVARLPPFKKNPANFATITSDTKYRVPSGYSGQNIYIRGGISYTDELTKGKILDPFCQRVSASAVFGSKSGGAGNGISLGAIDFPDCDDEIPRTKK